MRILPRMATRISQLSDRPTLWAARLGAAGILLALLSRNRVADLDMFHQMALIREAIAAGRIPWNDVFAYTPTVQPAVHHEWGTGAVLYLVTVAAGLGAAGLMALRYALTAGVVAGCVVCARRRGAEERVFLALAPLAAALAWVGFTTIRAQVFSLLFLVLLLLLLEEDRRGRRWWLAAWLPLYVIWLNLHAGFLIGAGVFALYTAERAASELATGAGIRQLARHVGHLVAAGLAMAALAVVNPWGFAYIEYLWRAVWLHREWIPEWQPLWRHPQAWLYLPLFGMSLAVVAYAAVHRRGRDLPGLLTVVVAAFLALWHFRHLSIYGVLWICYVPAYLESTPLGRALGKACIGRTMFVAWSLSAVVEVGFAVSNQFWSPWLPTRETETGDNPAIYPGGAVAYLAEHRFAGNLMTPYNAGSYVSWKLFPAVKVSMDSRYEVAYPPAALDENVRFYHGEPGWRKILERYATDAVLVPRSSPIDRLLAAKPPDARTRPSGWYLAYRDDGYSIFARAKFRDRLPPVDRTGQTISATFP
ncbi:MAG: hypothetical protein ACYC35_08250 [Pirellulales bacterium]